VRVGCATEGAPGMMLTRRYADMQYRYHLCFKTQVHLPRVLRALRISWKGPTRRVTGHIHAHSSRCHAPQAPRRAQTQLRYVSISCTVQGCFEARGTGARVPRRPCNGPIVPARQAIARGTHATFGTHRQHQKLSPTACAITREGMWCGYMGRWLGLAGECGSSTLTIGAVGAAAAVAI